MQLAIFGTNHRHQIVGYPEGRSLDLQSHLTALVRSYGYDALAEELSEESIDLWKGTDSTGRLVANRLGIQHLYCDPTTAERDKLGIPSDRKIRESLKFGVATNHEQTARLDAEQKKYWPIRESFWFQRLQGLGANHTLFILGSDHIPSFSAFLNRESVRFVCLNERWEP